MEKTVSEEHKELKELFKSKDLFDRVTKEVYLSIIKIASIGQKTLCVQNEKPLKMFLLLQQFLCFALESHIEEKSQALGVKLVIDKDLINETVLQDNVDQIATNFVDDSLYPDDS